MSAATLRQAIIAVGTDALDGVLTGTRDLTLDLLDLSALMLEVLHDAMFARVRFPFIEKVTALVDPEGSVDTSFRLIDGIMLYCAIPATIAYKLFFDEAPVTSGEVIALPSGTITIQSMTPAELEPVKKFSWTVGLGAAFAKAALTVNQLRKAGQGTAPDPPTFLTRLVPVVFRSLGVAAEYAGHRSGRGETSSGIEWTMCGVSTAMLGKSIALWVWDEKCGPAPAPTPPIGVTRDNQIDIAGYVVHLALRAADFGVMETLKIQRTGMQELVEILAFFEATCDTIGSTGTSVATSIKEADTKSLVLASALAFKLVAFGSNIVRVKMSGQLDQALIY
jgi:hypothetical protein